MFSKLHTDQAAVPLMELEEPVDTSHPASRKTPLALVAKQGRRKQTPRSGSARSCPLSCRTIVTVLNFNGDMRLQVFIIALLSGLLLWGAWFYVTRAAYREAHEFGVIPNLHIKEKIGLTR
jgi:hypothetical protein